MEFVLEIVFQFFGEILLQALFELLAELGLRALADPLRKQRSAAFSIAGYALWGLIAGAISLFLFPASAIRNSAFRLANLFVTPLLLGLVMALIGKRRRNRGDSLIRLESFGYAFLFAFSMALVRFIWAN